MNDALGNPINVGDHVAVAFSYSQASVGHLRFGTVEELRPRPDPDPEPWYYQDEIVIRWDEGSYDTKAVMTLKYVKSRFLVIP